MKKWLKHEVSNDFFLALGRLNWRMRKFFAILGLIAMLGSMIPSNRYVYSETRIPSENDVSSAEELYQPMDVDLADIPVSNEETSLRSETGKVFKKVDGTFEAAIYNDAIHYLEDGKWKDIDNSLIFDTESNSYQNRLNNLKLNSRSHSIATNRLNCRWENIRLIGRCSISTDPILLSMIELKLRPILRNSQRLTSRYCMKRYLLM